MMTPERKRAYMKERYATNPTPTRERSMQWYYDNREAILADRKRDRESNPEKRILIAAKNRAKDKSLPFGITEADIVIPEVCPVLGIPLVYGAGGRTDASPSLDKIIPSLGYVPGNVAVISWRANRIKNDGTREEHEKIAAWMKSQ